MSVAELVAAVKGQILCQRQGQGQHQDQHRESFIGVATDTRKTMQDALFIPLKGERFDAHDFLVDAVRQKASVVLTHKTAEELGEECWRHLNGHVTVVKVDDTLRALQDLSRYWRKRLTASVVAITGSNGKTTTKKFVQSIVGSQKKTYASPGSFNNHWGVPLSLLEASLSDECVILEMGMNHTGEIAALTEIAEPDVVIVTTVGSAHIGELGSVERIAEAKQEIYDRAPASSIRIFNLDNEMTAKMYKNFVSNGGNDISGFYRFSAFRQDVDVSLRIEEMQLNHMVVSGVIGEVSGRCELQLFGRQNVFNLMAAASIALAVGLTAEQIWSALPNCQSPLGRNQLVMSDFGQILFDGYNANPESMASLIRNLFEIQTLGKKVAVIGEMLEMGPQTAEEHRKLGELLGNTDIGWVWFIGPSFASVKEGIESCGYQGQARYSEKMDRALATELREHLNKEDIIALKGSRGVRMEQVLEAWGLANPFKADA